MRRRGPIAAAALVAVAAAVTVFAGLSEDEPPPGPQSRSAAPPAGAGTQVAYQPQPERRFVRVGTTNKQQFTDEQFRFLVDNFHVVLFTKFHGGFDIRLHHEAARRLVAARPDVQVYPYFSTKYWFDQNRWDGAEINPAWLLRDNAGNLVVRHKERDEEDVAVSTYVDLANPDYRRWALQVLASWLEAAPYAGISFDAADPIGDFGREKELERWDRLLGKERVDAYNDGLRELLASAQKLVGPGRDVVFNGISPSTIRGPERDLDLLALTDGALNERFCLDVRSNVHAVYEDISLLESQKDKRLFMRTNFKSSFDATKREQFERYCLGVFLMGWKPGLSYFQIGGDYTADQLKEQNPNLDVNLGRPVAPYRRQGSLARRDFGNGIVYVNMGNKPSSVKLDRNFTEVRGGRIRESHQPGDSISVPPHDAVYLIKTALLPSHPQS